MKRREAEQGAGVGGWERGVREGGLSWGLILKVYVSEETVQSRKLKK